MKTRKTITAPGVTHNAPEKDDRHENSERYEQHPEAASKTPRKRQMMSRRCRSYVSAGYPVGDT